MRWKFVAPFVVTCGAVALVAFAADRMIPPVMKDLGPVRPTPVPSPQVSNRIRMITSFTVQNKPDGDSIISLEATDFGKGANDTFKILANETYSLLQSKQEHRELRDKIVRKLRDLEGDLLEYVEKVGPPRDRETIMQGSGSKPPQ